MPLDLKDVFRQALGEGSSGLRQIGQSLELDSNGFGCPQKISVGVIQRWFW